MAKVSFDAYMGWVNITNPNQIPENARVISADDLLRYEKLGKDTAAKFAELDTTVAGWKSDTIISDLIEKETSDTRYVVDSLVKVGVTAGVAKFQKVIDEVPAKVEAQVVPLVAKTISADGTVAAAAAAAVTKDIAGRDLLEGTDTRVPTIENSPGTLYAVVDANRRQTWLAANDVDGGPTDWAMTQIGSKFQPDHFSAPVLNEIGQRIGEGLGTHFLDSPGILAGITDSNGIRTWIEANDTDGGLTEHAANMVIKAVEPRLGSGGGTGGGGFLSSDQVVINGEMRPLLTNMKRVAMWASSSGDYGSPYIKEPFEAAGATYFNHGKWGEFGEHIAARMGARPALCTVAGGTIPQTGPVNVTISNMPYRDLLKTFRGWLNGVYGDLSADQANDLWVFTRVGTGTSVPISGEHPFIPEVGPQHRADVNILWAGKNNMGRSTGAEEAISITDQMYDYLTPLVKRTLVLGHFVDTDTTATSTNRERIYRTNAYQKARYGNHFVDIHEYTIGAQIWIDAGVAPTAADLAQQAIGNKPPSLSSDSLHYNTAGNIAVSKLIERRIRELGWY